MGRELGGPSSKGAGENLAAQTSTSHLHSQNRGDSDSATTRGPENVDLPLIPLTCLTSVHSIATRGEDSFPLPHPEQDGRRAVGVGYEREPECRDLTYPRPLD